MRLVPIVALVSDDTLAALTELVNQAPEPPMSWQDVMDRNGWTAEQVIAGDMIACALGLAALPDPTPENVEEP